MTKTIKGYVLKLGYGVGVKLKGTVSFLKNDIRLSLEPPFFFKIEWYTNK